MREDIIKLKEDIESFLKDSMEHQNKQIEYILYNQKTNETITLASNGVDEAIEFAPYITDGKFNYVPEWDFNFDYYILNELEENNYQIGYMSMNTHYGLWNSISELYPNDIEYKDGLQKYMKYCKDNNITKEIIDKETGLNTPDIMEYYCEMEYGEFFEYKDYVAEVGEFNVDNLKESIVYIYKKEDFQTTNEIYKTISLNNKDLKLNIKEYIDDNLQRDNHIYINDNNVNMSKEKYENDSEKAYITFVLGYDLLNSMIKKYNTMECDVNYDFCNNIASNFMDSDYYHNIKYSTYEMLEKWVSDNKENIKLEYKDFIGYEQKTNFTRTLDNGISVIDLGYRKEQPVALVCKNENEYIIAFNYRIKDNKMDWAYGYYYDNDKNKAENDFKKVLAGDSLSKTFEDKER